MPLTGRSFARRGTSGPWARIGEAKGAQSFVIPESKQPAPRHKDTGADASWKCLKRSRGIFSQVRKAAGEFKMQIVTAHPDLSWNNDNACRSSRAVRTCS